MKRKMRHPGRTWGRGNNYQQQVISIVGYSSKRVGLTYRDWLREHISIALTLQIAVPSVDS